MASPRTAPALKVHDLTVAYRDQPVLWDIDLTVPQGVLMAIMGPNGAGKTTLIKSMLGLLKPAAGSIRIFGQPADRTTMRRIAYVPQRTSVDWDFPTDVADVVMMGRYGEMGWLRRPALRDRQAVAEALAKVGMDSLAHRQISELSGGQQQRVFLARALVQEAEVYLMDEPFQGVDATTETAIVEVLRALRRQGRTVVAVHHDLNTVQKYFDWIALLNVHLMAEGGMEETFTEANLRRTFGSAVVQWSGS